MSFDPIVLGQTLKKQRTKMKMGVRETAKRVGISPGYITQLEKGMIKKPSIEIIESLFTILKMEGIYISDNTEEQAYKDKILDSISVMNLEELKAMEFILKCSGLVSNLYEINQKSNKKEKVLAGICDYIHYQHNRYVTRRIERLFED